MTKFPLPSFDDGKAEPPNFETLHLLAAKSRTPVGNPTVFHPTQALFEAAAEKETANAKPSTPPKNGKQVHLNKGMLRARCVLENRHKAIRTFEENVDDTMSFGLKIGVCLTLLQPWFGLPLIGAVFGINSLSHYIAGKSCALLTENLQDLELCRSADTSLLQKQQAITKLRKTGRYMSLWEKFCDAGISIGKFLFGEVHRVAGVMDMMFDVNKDLTKRPKPQHQPSDSLRGALSQICYGLNLNKQKKLQVAIGS